MEGLAPANVEITVSFKEVGSGSADMTVVIIGGIVIIVVVGALGRYFLSKKKDKNKGI